MRALIIEDEEISFRMLRRMLQELRPDMEIDGPLTTVSEVISRLSEYSGYDLIFSDITAGPRGIRRISGSDARMYGHIHYRL